MFTLTNHNCHTLRTARKTSNTHSLLVLMSEAPYRPSRRDILAANRARKALTLDQALDIPALGVQVSRPEHNT